MIPVFYVPKENSQTNQEFLLGAEVHECGENLIILFHKNVYHLYEKSMVMMNVDTREGELSTNSMRYPYKISQLSSE